MDSSLSFPDAVQGFLAGDFTRLEPLVTTPPDGSPCRAVEWYDAGLFAAEPAALDEAFSCARFNGCVPAVEALLARGVNPAGGAGTGLNAFHWAADRGQLDVVKMLLHHGAPLEVRNSYGGTVLGCVVYSAVQKMRPNHIPIIESLLAAGADVRAADYPSGDERVDDVLRRYRSETT
jgi:ankyrin repeat protein